MTSWRTTRFLWFVVLLTILAAHTGTSPRVAADPYAVDANAGWEEIGVGSATGGGISNNAGDSRMVALAILPDGRPVVAWSDDSNGNQEIYVRHWNGSAWVEMGAGSASGGGISDNLEDSYEPSMGLGADGTPIVAWYDYSSGDSEIYIRHWNGTSWVEMGAGSATGGGISDNDGGSFSPSLATTSDGTPIVAWTDGSGGDREIYVRRWDGAGWAELGASSASGGGISNKGGSSYSPSLAVTAEGNPYVAWYFFQSDGEGTEIYTLGWDGFSWVELGGSVTGGGVSNSPGVSISPSLAIDPEGAPVVAWSDDSSGQFEIYVRRWDGLAWVEIDDGSATGGGISAGGGHSVDPSLIVTGDWPYVVWADDTINYEIYLLRHIFDNWAEMWAGSASDGGISNNDSMSLDPSLAVTPDGRHVLAWADGGEVYVRRTAPTADSCHFLTLIYSGGGAAPTADPTNSAGCGPGYYKAGREILLTAEPMGGWRVGGWMGTDDDTSTNHTNTVTMPAADHTVYLIYVPDEIEVDCYFLTLSHSGQGAGPTANPPDSSLCSTGYYEAGELIALTAAPAAGWHVAGWSGSNDDGSTALSNLLNMPPNHHTVSVTYAPDDPTCYPLTRAHNGQGSDPTANPANSTGCATGHYTAGQAITLTASPANGWRVKNWSGTANDAGATATNSLIMPAAEHTVGVTYEQIPVMTHYLFAPAILYRPVTCFPGPDEQEPNNNQSQANGPLCNGRAYNGLPNDSFDVFTIEVTDAGAITIELNNHTGGGVQLGLLSAEFKPIVYDTEAAGDFRIDYASGAAGRYYIVVFAETPGNATPYTLRATFATR